MNYLDIILLAIALAMDCFAVSIASGIILKKFDWRTVLRMALLFGIFQAIMPLVGWSVGIWFKSYIEVYDHWIALVLLSLLGVKMIREGTATDEENNERVKTICPLKWSSLFMMALATSIDALATGIVFIPFSTVLLCWALVIIGVVSVFFSILGSYIGVHFGNKLSFNIEIFGGIMLISIGLKIFISHMFLN